MPRAAQGGDGTGEAEQSLRRSAAKRDDAGGFDDVDFRTEEGEAGGDFRRIGGAVVGGLLRDGGAEFDDGSEIDLLAGEAHGLEDVIELLAGRADEGLAGDFLLIAGCLADEHDAGVGIASGEDEDVAQGAEAAGGRPIFRLAAEGIELLGAGGAGDGEGGGSRGGDFRRRRGLGDHGGRGGAGFGEMEEAAQAVARAVIQQDVGNSAGLLGGEELKQDIDWTNHAATLPGGRAGCNRRIDPSGGGPRGSDQGLGVALNLWTAAALLPTRLLLARGGKLEQFPEHRPKNMSFKPKLPGSLSAPQWYSGPNLWKTLRRAALVAGRKSLLTALTLFYCLKDQDTPTWARGVIVGALGYLVLPTDLVPDLLPGIGYGDDWGALVAALGTVAAYIKDEHKSKAAAQLERLFGAANPAAPPEFFE